MSRRIVRLFSAFWVLLASPALAQPLAFDGVIGDFPFVLEPLQPVITGPIDTRFFGLYCQPSPKEFCKSVPILPDPCVTLRDTRVRIDHLTTPQGGLLTGGGSFVLDGERGQLALVGVVLGRNVSIAGITLPGSLARAMVNAPGLGDRRGNLLLANNGVSLTAFLEGRSVVLSKEACGNNPPTVDLIAPFGPDFPYGQSVMLAGTITDEDTVFPEERLVFRSNRQSLLSGNRVAGGRTLFVSNFIPGPHRITFTVTDSGGLARSATLDINILNRPPKSPRIFLPVEGATLFAGAPVLLQGNAIDPDSGVLSGSSLQWTAQLSPGAPFVALGSGTEVGTIFQDPADPVRIRLTASDNTGQTAFADRLVRVAPSTGNAPPVVAIRLPDRTTVDSPTIASFLTLEPANFGGTAFDAEDSLADLTIVWEVVAINGTGGAPLASPPVPNPAPVTGTLAPVINFHPNANLFYRVTLKATDTGGATSTDSIEVFTFSTPIL